MAKDSFRVLIVDDEADIRDSIGMVLETMIPGVGVTMADDGVAALKAIQEAQESDDPIDLILSDYKMPNMDGIEFLHIIKERYPDIPRLMLTAYPDPQLAAQAVKEAGVGLFIAKPFDPEYVGEVIKAFAPHS